MKFNRKITAICLSVAAALAAGFVSVNASSQPRDCDNNSIMRCGAYSASEFKEKYKKNAPGDLDNIYKHYGINVDAIGSAKSGVVKKNGDVVVDGKVVAKDAYGVGRQNLPGSKKITINGKTYYERKDTRNFLSDIKAFVFFDKDGQFKYAVLKSCGNPEMATPVKPPKKPHAACKDLSFKAITRTKYEFNASANANSTAEIVKYGFHFGDGTTDSVFTSKNSASITHTYAKAGTYEAYVNVTYRGTKISEKDMVTSEDCKVKITVKEAPAAECKSLKAVVTKDNDVTLSANASTSNGATIKGYTFTVKDESGKVAFTKSIDSTATTASVTNGFTSGNYTADVVVHTSEGDKNGAQCKTTFSIPKAPVAVCKSLAATITNRTNVALAANAEVSDGATVTGYIFTITNGANTVYTQTVNTAALSASANTTLPAGTYTAKVTVKTSVGDKTGANCEKTFTIVEAPAAECKSLTATIRNRDEFTLDAAAQVSNGATVTGYVFTVKNAAGATVYTQNVASSNLNASVNSTLPAGLYSANVVVKTSVGDKTGTQCNDTFTISEAPVAECKSLTATVLNRTNYTLTASASASNGATISGYQFVIKNTSGAVVRDATQASNVLTGTLAPGAYSAVVTAKTSLGDRTSTGCTTTFTIEVEKCPVPGKENLPKDSPDCYENCPVPGKEHLPKNSPDCKEDVKYCDVPGKEHLPVDSPLCKEDEVEYCDVPGKENLPVNSPDCVETPEEEEETPVLPETGAKALFSLFGLGGISAAAVAYARSRRQ